MCPTGDAAELLIQLVRIATAKLIGLHDANPPQVAGNRWADVRQVFEIGYIFVGHWYVSSLSMDDTEESDQNQEFDCFIRAICVIRGCLGLRCPSAVAIFSRRA